jgi:hypothetical protein
MEQLGFFVCDTDVEDELIRAIGTADVVQLIDTAGDLGAFQALQQQPSYGRRRLTIKSVPSCVAARSSTRRFSSTPSISRASLLRLTAY